jgi:Sulfotransferase family
VNPYVFIVGCARSGTTLLRRMVDAHPDIAITRETHWIAKRFERQEGVTADGLVTPELFSRLLSYEKFTRMRIDQDELEGLVAGEEPVPYSSFVTGVFDLYGKVQGKRLVGDKTPAYVRSIPTLHDLWPEAKFVHIVRDGRDVALSAVNWDRAYKLANRYSTWTEHPTTTAAVWWEWLVRLGREAGSLLGPDLYHEVRYEELISEPEGTCETLCTFLALPYDDAMLRFHERLPDPRFYAKQKRWRPISTGLRDWRSQMDAGEVECFEAAAGDLLDELGYPRAAPVPSREKLENAVGIRASFIRDVIARGERLPEVWKT